MYENGPRQSVRVQRDHKLTAATRPVIGPLREQIQRLTRPTRTVCRQRGAGPYASTINMGPVHRKRPAAAEMTLADTHAYGEHTTGGKVGRSAR